MSWCVRMRCVSGGTDALYVHAVPMQHASRAHIWRSHQAGPSYLLTQSTHYPDTRTYAPTHLRTYVFTQAQHNADEHLATEFTTSDAGGWGWERAEPVRVTCSDGNVNVGNRCVTDAGLSEGRVREPAASRVAS